MVDLETYTPKLIDWGHSDFYLVGESMGNKVGTASYKAPELLLNYYYYDYGIDIWALGAIFAGMLFDKKIFFQT